ncbi:MAG: translocation/assembly module TamB domain-containing protein, partial [Candidatus Caldatribacteriaceae bacterium]
ISFCKDFSYFSVKGTTEEVTEERDVVLQGGYQPHFVEGILKGKSKSSSIRGRFRYNLEDGSLLFDAEPGSSWQGMEFFGRLRGEERGGLSLYLENLSVLWGEKFTLFPLRGSGQLRGDLKREGEEWSGKLVFSSPSCVLQGWDIENVVFEASFAQKTANFQGKGELFGGYLEISGTYGEGGVKALGKVGKLKAEEILGRENIPLSGVIFGEIGVEGKSEDFVVSLSFRDGSLFWQGVNLGRISGGRVAFWKGEVELRGLLVTQGEGSFTSNLVKDSQGLRGEVFFQNYPLQLPFERESLRCILGGKVDFQWNGKLFEGKFDLTAPSWSLGGMRGWDGVLLGSVQGKEVNLQCLALSWEGGRLETTGKMILGREIQLEGNIEHLRLPENTLCLSGEVKRAYFSLSGPWEGAQWVLQGEGSSLFILGEPLGEYISLKLSGKFSLSKLFEEQASFLDMVSPQALKEGEITVRGMNMALLGGRFFKEGKGKGEMDITFFLDPQKKVWRLKSDNVLLSFPRYGELQGVVRGVYDGRIISLDAMDFRERGGVSLRGKGSFDVVRKTWDLRLEVEGNTSFELSENLDLSLRGKGEFHLWGDAESMYREGNVELEDMQVFHGGKEYLNLQSVFGKLSQDVFTFSSREGTFLGGKLEVEGEFTRERILVRGHLQGEGFPFGTFGAFQGRWEGDLTLEGEKGNYALLGTILLHNASLDTRHRKGSWDFSTSLSQVFGDLPLSMKLDLVFSDTLKVRTDFLYLVLSGGISFVKEGQKVLLLGRLRVEEGKYDLIACDVPLEGYIVFTELDGFEPQLYLEGRKRMQGYDIALQVRGPLKQYSLSFSSEPFLTREEILSLLFLGDKDAYVSIEKVKLGPVLQKIARFLLTKDLNLGTIPLFDAITFEEGDFSKITLEKRLGKNVSFGYTQNLNGGSAVEVEIDFSKEWSFRLRNDDKGRVEWMLEFSTKF